MFDNNINVLEILKQTLNPDEVKISISDFFLADAKTHISLPKQILKNFYWRG